MVNQIDICMPASEEGTEAVVERWLKAVGDAVEANQPLLEINTDKVSMEIAAPASGILSEILKQANAPVVPGEVLGRMEVTESKGEDLSRKSEVGSGRLEVESRKSEGELKSLHRRTGDGEREVRLSPIVRRMLSEHRIDPGDILGSGNGGRITARDVEQHLEQRRTVAKPAATPRQSTYPSSGVPSRMLPHNAMRRATARHMIDSMLHTAPHVTAVFEVDLSAIIAQRAANKSSYAEKGVNLTFTAYFLSAAAQAMRAVPEINSRWHDDALEVFEDVNIGIATATEKGLIVPVLKRVQSLSLFDIAEQLQLLTARARTGKLEKSELQKGTFTITNHGVSGSLIATPIINQPQSAILGIGKMEKRIVIGEKDGEDVPVIRPMAYVTLTIDHRALDGFQANRFLTAFVEGLQGFNE